MRTISTAAVIGLLSARILIAPCHADDPETTPKRQLDKLLETYKSYGLPLPPRDAKLIRYQWSEDGKSGLAFLLAPQKKGEEVQVLSEWFGGPWESPIWLYEKREVVQPTRELATTIDDPGYIIAILCHARGWTDLSEALIVRYLQNNEGDLSDELALAAWYHWTSNLNNRTTDWSKLAPRLKHILDSRPKAFKLHHQSFLRSMELALQPSKAKPGSMEALLDGLIHEPLTFGELQTSEAYRKVVGVGFAIVPTLIAHLNDERLTRTRRGRFNNFPGFQYRLQHFASDMLQDLAGEDLGMDGLRRMQGYIVEKPDAEAWWNKARVVGEEQYLVRHVFGASPDLKWPNSTMLYIIGRKYPQRLAGLYRTMLAERPNMAGWSVAQTVAESPLSIGEKREIFLMVAAAKNLDHRCDALWKLEKIDPQRFAPIMIATLEEMARTPDRHNSRYAHLVQQTTDPAIWTALQKAAERADPALRIKYVDAMRGYEKRKPARKQQIVFLAHFLADASEAQYGWSGFAMIQVRNMAAWRAAGILQMDVNPEPNWTDAQWETLRKQVKERLEREGIK